MVLDNILNLCNIRKGERIWLSSEVIRLALIMRNAGEQFDPDKMLDTIISRLGDEGTLILPVFSYEFSNDGRYDYIHTRGTAGALGNVALQRKDFKRTKHPIHSFAVWGKDKEILFGMDNINSYGVDSPFEYCKENNVRQIMLGTDYAHAMTFIHFCEAVCNVPYRFVKSFSGQYFDENGNETTRTYDLFVRYREIKTTSRFNDMGRILEEKGVSTKFSYENYECYSIDLGSSYDIICDDMHNNMCRNIYDFNVDRDKLFKGLLINEN